MAGSGGALQLSAPGSCSSCPPWRLALLCPPDMPEEAGFPPAKRFRQGCGPPSRAGSCPPTRRVVMLLSAGGGGGGGGRRQQLPLAQPSASPYREAVELQRRSLPIFQARGQLLAQLRNLDSAVLIGEWPRGQVLPCSRLCESSFFRCLSPSFICFRNKPDRLLRGLARGRALEESERPTLEVFTIRWE